MYIYLQIFIRYLCSSGLPSTAWCWQPQLSAWQPVPSPYSLVGGIWRSCMPQCQPGQGHTVARGNPGSLVGQELKLLVQQSPRLWLPKLHKVEDSFAKRPFVTADSNSRLSRDIFKGLCAYSLAGSHSERF